MDFKGNKSIYLQVADRICDEILLDKIHEEERIPSVREYASVVEVNANTVMRSYDYLQSLGIIYNKRGIGYFSALHSKELIANLRKGTFMKEDINSFFYQIYTLHIPMKDIVKLYNEFVKNLNSNKE
jgi:GntR family transcriptional regulator